MMTIRPLLPLACVAWLLSLFLIAPEAQKAQAAASATANPHLDLTLFTHSENCVACHNNLVAGDGEDVSIGSTWRSTMMANSARDPYWQAAVRRETIDHPTHSAAIQDECAACHMPMSQRITKAAGGTGEVFAQLPMASANNSELHRLAADSISCTVCHQMAPDRLGTRESFNANFVVKPIPPGGTRLIYGPYAIDAGRKTIMRSVTGYEQAEAPHITQSELCASCHTLITEAYGPSGEVVGTLPEQMNYQEWQHSAFNTEQRSCQSCHMPKAKGPVRAASVLGDERDSLSRHLFVGGNAFMVRMLSRYRTELGVLALPAELEATARATIRQLQEETARLTVSPPRLDNGTLMFDVNVRNLSGHKFPTGYPARRAWLHVTVRDDWGTTVFESGAIDAAGAVAGNAADADPLVFEPHYEAITRSDEVQIYESILGTPAGVPTTGLLSATQYLKDNRLLPRGFDKATAAADVGVYGGAARDADFAGEGDRVRYAVAVAAGGSFTVDVVLRYQSIGYRWAHNLDAYDAAEPKRFASYYRAMSSNASVAVATASVRVDGARP